MRISIARNSCFSSCLSRKSEENSASFIDIKNTPISSGGQGKIFEVTHIDGRPISGLLIKSFENGFPSNLKEIVSIIRDNKDEYKIDQSIALRSLPLFLFEGRLNNTPFYGYVMRKVKGEPFSKIIEDDINRYINLPLEDRLQLCLQFVEGMNILYCLTIVHADINGQNILIDTTSKTLSIIDLDGGAVAKTGSTPVVIGKLEPGWLDPQIQSQLLGTIRQQAITVKVTADLWSIACGVHHLLFGFAPFFFIREQPQVKKYLQTYRWPKLNGISGIIIQNHSAFDYYERTYRKVPELQRLLEMSFNKGYFDTQQRPSAYLWMQAIRRELIRMAPSLPLSQKEKELHRYIEIALRDGVLTQEEKIFILELGEKIGIDRGNVEKLIDEEVQKRKAKVGLSRAVGTGIPQLEISKTSFDFQNIRTDSFTSASFTIINIGGGTLTGTIKSNKNWLKVSQTNIDTTRHKQDITFYIDTSGLPFGSKDIGTIEIRSNGGTKTITVNLSVEIPDTALSRFRWQFIPALAVICGSVGVLTSEFLGPIMGFVGIILLSFFTARVSSEEGFGAAICWFLIPLVVLSIILSGLYDGLSHRVGSAFGGVLFSLGISPFLSKLVFRYQCATSKNLILPVWIIASMGAISIGFIVTKSEEAMIKDITNKLPGKWHGVVANNEAILFITQKDKQLSGKIIYMDIDEKLSVDVKGDGQVVLKGIGYQRISGKGRFALDTFYGRLSNDGRSIRGNYKDAAGNRGEWSVSKVSEREDSPTQPKTSPRRSPHATPSFPPTTPIPEPLPSSPAPEPPAPAPEPTSFTVTIYSSPSGATVNIDKQYAGITPLSISLKKGVHGITIEKDGYKTKWDIVEVDKKGEKEFYFTLEKE